MNLNWLLILRTSYSSIYCTVWITALQAAILTGWGTGNNRNNKRYLFWFYIRLLNKKEVCNFWQLYGSVPRIINGSMLRQHKEEYYALRAKFTVLTHTGNSLSLLVFSLHKGRNQIPGPLTFKIPDHRPLNRTKKFLIFFRKPVFRNRNFLH